MAITPQFPVLRSLTTLPETLQFPFGTTMKLTGNPELAVALTVRLVPTTCAAIGLNVIVCATGVAEVTTRLMVVVSTLEPDVPVIVSG